MAQRHEIEAWVNPSAWDDEAAGWAAVDAIEAARTDDVVVWVRIVGEHSGDDVTVEEITAAATARDERAAQAFSLAVAAVLNGRLSEVKAAQAAGVARDTLRARVKAARGLRA